MNNSEIVRTDPYATYKTTKSVLPSRSAPTTACLVYIYPTGPQMGTRYVLGGKYNFIGRTDECSVRNQDQSVSRTHARIEHRDDGYWIVDLQSTNGTFVNNVQVAERQLDDGDYVRIGSCIYRYLAGGNIEAEYHEEIYRLTVQDALTGIHNRRSLMDFLDRELARAQRYQRPLALALFDIDHFKKLNDEFGHLAGDTVLRDLCQLLRTTVRKDELLARYGGEEFAMVLPETGLPEAQLAAERLREAVATCMFTYQTKRLPVTVSVGVSISTGETRDPQSLIEAADAKLYEAKSAGRNRVAI